MIDEQISQHECIGCEPGKFCGDCRRLLTAIYEIGLEVIGKDGEVTGYERPNGNLSVDLTESYRNELRKEQRIAWAKACGLAEK